MENRTLFFYNESECGEPCGVAIFSTEEQAEQAAKKWFRIWYAANTTDEYDSIELDRDFIGKVMRECDGLQAFFPLECRETYNMTTSF